MNIELLHYSEIFYIIKKYVRKKKQQEVAKTYWKKFLKLGVSPSELHCDATLCALGLAREMQTLSGEEHLVYWVPKDEI